MMWLHGAVGFICRSGGAAVIVQREKKRLTALIQNTTGHVAAVHSEGQQGQNSSNICSKEQLHLKPSSGS